MAKAVYHKNQRVFVKTVGTWALIEKVMPQWAKGLDEPLRIFYDVGLGRDFLAEELQPDMLGDAPVGSAHSEQWRVVRTRNKWKSVEECSQHPFPGTFPTVVTGEVDWGGWRVPGAEYDLYPERVELQARLVASAPKMAALLRSLVRHARLEPDEMSDDVASLIREAGAILRYIDQEVQQ